MSVFLLLDILCLSHANSFLFESFGYSSKNIGCRSFPCSALSLYMIKNLSTCSFFVGRREIMFLMCCMSACVPLCSLLRAAPPVWALAATLSTTMRVARDCFTLCSTHHCCKGGRSVTDLHVLLSLTLVESACVTLTVHNGVHES